MLEKLTAPSYSILTPPGVSEETISSPPMKIVLLPEIQGLCQTTPIIQQLLLETYDLSPQNFLHGIMVADAASFIFTQALPVELKNMEILKELEASFSTMIVAANLHDIGKIIDPELCQSFYHTDQSQNRTLHQIATQHLHPLVGYQFLETLDLFIQKNNIISPISFQKVAQLAVLHHVNPFGNIITKDDRGSASYPDYTPETPVEKLLTIIIQAADVIVSTGTPRPSYRNFSLPLYNTMSALCNIFNQQKMQYIFHELTPTQASRLRNHLFETSLKALVACQRKYPEEFCKNNNINPLMNKIDPSLPPIIPQILDLMSQNKGYLSKRNALYQQQRELFEHLIFKDRKKVFKKPIHNFF